MTTSRRTGYDTDAFTASGGPALHTALTGIVEQIRVLYSQALEVVGAMDDASIAHLAGYPSLEAFLVTTQRVSRRHARQLVSHASSVRETVTPTGHHQPAALPAVRAALADGVLGADHVEEIVKTVAEVPDWASGAARELVETTLVAEARTADPAYVRAAGKELVARIDQDGRPPREEELAEPANSFHYHRTHTGRMRFTGDVEPETAELLDAMLSPLSKPNPSATSSRTSAAPRSGWGTRSAPWCTPHPTARTYRPRAGSGPPSTSRWTTRSSSPGSGRPPSSWATRSPRRPCGGWRVTRI